MSIEQKMHYQIQLEEATKKKKKNLIAVCTLGLSQTPLVENIRNADDTKNKMSFGDTPLGLVFGIAWFLFWTLLSMAVLWVINIVKLIVHAIHCNELKKLIDAEQE